MKPLSSGPTLLAHWIWSARAKELLMRSTTEGRSWPGRGLIRVHGGGEVVVRRHLPAGEIDGFDAGLGLLHRLAAGQGAEAVYIAFLGAAVDQLPQFVGAALGQSVCRLQAATQVHHVLGAVAALDPFPAGFSAQSFSIAWICCSRVSAISVPSFIDFTFPLTCYGAVTGPGSHSRS